MRLPVAAKIALSTAGAATAIVGSPTPLQKSPVGMMTTSTFGISRMRVGYGSAIGVILFVICVSFAFTYKRWFMRDE